MHYNQMYGPPAEFHAASSEQKHYSISIIPNATTRQWDRLFTWKTDRLSINVRLGGDPW